jgi:WD40 repeat protein
LTFDEHSPHSVSWSPDGRQVVTASSVDSSAKIWDPNTGQVSLDLFPSDITYGVLGVAWSPDGEKIATISTDGLARIWDPVSGEQLLAFNGPSSEDWVSWSPSGDYLAIGGEIFNASTGNQVLDFNYSFASWSPQGTALALNSYTYDLVVFPIWPSLDELVDFAKSCCLIGSLTAEERLEFGLPPRQE